MDKTKLRIIAQRLVQKGKGILAADESIPTIGKRFDNINLENNLINREKYRRLLFTTPNLSNYISGVITFDETLCNQELTDNLIKNDILLGIKVDKGVKDLYNSDGETVTQGLDNLDERCKEYHSLGATFAKWRGVLKIDVLNNCPSNLSINQNAECLARYAAICQNNGLVPIVEPEIVMDGNHNLKESYTASVNVLDVVYKKLEEHHVYLPGTLLKPNMVRPGVEHGNDLSYEHISNTTISAFNKTVPNEVPGIVFLSGGLSEEDATLILNEINMVNKKHKDWALSFSYGRALQHSVLKAWQGKEENVTRAQEVLLQRCEANSLATFGKYIQKSNENDTNDDLHVKNYAY